VAAVNGGNVGDATAIVIAVADDMIIEERFHGGNLARAVGKWKGKSWSAKRVTRGWSGEFPAFFQDGWFCGRLPDTLCLANFRGSLRDNRSSRREEALTHGAEFEMSLLTSAATRLNEGRARRASGWLCDTSRNTV
jgi:hypothetical protein